MKGYGETMLGQDLVSFAIKAARIAREESHTRHHMYLHAGVSSLFLTTQVGRDLLKAADQFGSSLMRAAWDQHEKILLCQCVNTVGL